MNLYMVVFIAGLAGYCGVFSDGTAKPDVAFFIDIKQAIEFKNLEETNICHKSRKPRIFKIVSKVPIEIDCEDSWKNQIEYRKCLKMLKFDIYEIDAIPITPVIPAIQYEIIETTCAVKETGTVKTD